MSIHVFENTVFAQLATFLVTTTHDETIKANGVKSIAHTLREANILSYMTRYGESDYERDIIHLAVETLPDANEIFFSARRLIIECVEWEEFFRSEAKRLLNEIMRLALCPAAAGGQQTFNATATPPQNAVGHLVYKKGHFGGEGIVVGVHHEQGGYLMGVGQLSGLTWKVIKLDTANESFYETEWPAEQCEFHNDKILPLFSVETVQGLKDELEQKRQREIKEREDAYKKKVAETKAFQAHCKTLMPAGTKAVIVANHIEDESDTMSDYHGSSTSKTIILAWSKHTRDVFSEMRKAAANHSVTAALKDAPKGAEHREKWSMGGGYYLKDGYRHSTGWEVRKVELYNDERSIPLGELADCLKPRSEKPEEKSKTAEQNAGTEMPEKAPGIIDIKYNEEKQGIELRFQDKPSEAIRTIMKENKFRWHRTGKFWYAKKTEKTDAAVGQITGQLAKEVIPTTTINPKPKLPVKPATPITMQNILFG